ncbi:MAG: 16S rRNA (cytosine(1402)-N(4))-methyltransferase RsmH [Deltaproteobacteria bacterium]|nr:16S rRNA (cytosine(1402)-N(4))-methyltransferase RsmH [Deltaproteobacteria bacterium]
MPMKHLPVLWKESIEGLRIDPDGIYVDCTLGGGGHAERILNRLSPEGRLVGFDSDSEAVVRVAERLAPFGSQFTPVQGNFREIRSRMETLGIEVVDGILMDLGVSTFQLASPERGFSFLHDAPLDMRMDQQAEIPTACDLVNREDRDTLKGILIRFGEERRWRPIVDAICRVREDHPIRTTKELADLVEKALPGARRFRIHPATRTFQALRIAVNGELAALEEGLAGAVDLLREGGRLCVISFHSLEDRIVKRFFHRLAKGCVCPPDFPVCVCKEEPVLRRVTRRPILPTEEEVRENLSARSAKLRIAEKRGKKK